LSFSPFFFSYSNRKTTTKMISKSLLSNFILVSVVTIGFGLVVDAQTVLWSLTASDYILTPPIVSEKHGLVLFGAGVNDGQMRAVNLQNGTVRWTWFPGSFSEIRSAPVIYKENLAIFGSSNRKFAAINLSTGLPVWEIFFAGPVFSDPYLVGDIIYLGTDDKQFHSVNASTGSIRWSYNAGSEIRGSPVVNGTIVVFGCINGLIVGLNTTTGLQIWNYSANAAPQAPMMISTSGYVCFGVDDGDVYGLFLHTGLLRFRWRSGTGGVRATPVEYNGLLYLGLSDGALYTIENQLGARIWKYQALASGSGSIGSAVIQRDYVFFASSDGNIRAINASTGTLDDPRFVWKVRETVDPLFPSPRPLYVGNNMVIGISGPTITAVSDPTIVIVTSPVPTPSDASATSSTQPQDGSPTTRAPYSTYVSNPADILLATSVPSAIVALLLFPVLAFLDL
jgi:outer membrane protein assembly factor BamB